MTKAGIKDGKQAPNYRVLRTLILITTRRSYEVGAIIDMSHQTQAGVRWYIDQGFIETADGEPENEPAAKAAPCKNC